MARISILTPTKTEVPLHFLVPTRDSPHDFTSHKNFKAVKLLFQTVAKGLSHHAPELLSEGDGGAYLLRDDRGSAAAIFKPLFEEPFSPLNPKNKSELDLNSGECLDLEVKQGIRLGEAAIREVAAYSLDHLAFAGVPPTLMVEIDGKEGSLQKHEAHDFESWDLGPAKYDRHQVHKIAILDLRIFNIDRHGGNILVRQLTGGKNYMIPIDHGFSLPGVLDGTDLWFEWINWPQAKLPFDRATKLYVANLNVGRDAEILRGLGIRKECIRTMVIATMVLKRGVVGGMNLYQIAQMYLRKVYGKRQICVPSLVEKIAERVGSVEAPDFMEVLGGVVEEEVGRVAEDKKKLTTSFVQIIDLPDPKREEQSRARSQLRTSA